MKFIGGLVLGLVAGVALTLFFTATDLGRGLAKAVTERIERLLHAAPKAAQNAVHDVPVDDVLARLKDAAERAESYAQRVGQGVKVEDLASELKDAAQKAGAQAGALWIQARQDALAAAKAAPDVDALGNSLEGWEKELAAYEIAQHAGDKDNKDAEAAEGRIAATFASPPAAQASAAATPGGFHTLAPFFKCPVMQVSNSGPTAADRTLTDYTPWVSTAAGALIRAPIAAACLSSGYGTRLQDGKSETHPGVDYYNRDGGPIFAAGNGVVTFAGEDPSYGYSVLIDHGAGVQGHYAHMVPGSLKVHMGDHVKQGEQIGSMGHSGRAYAVHLHYELRFAGQLVDPLYVGKLASH
jgi:murein DD-endopeptidase MepM/ murein hydrolase activator NlpD